MKHVEKAADAYFKQDSQGRTIFYPWGVMGYGYVVESEEQKEKIRKLLKNGRYVLIAGLVGIVGSIPEYVYAFVIAYMVWSYFMTSDLVKSMQRIDERKTIKDALANSASSQSTASIASLILVSIFLTGAAGFLLFSTQETNWTYYFLMGLFPLVLIYWFLVLIIKLKSK